MSNKGSVRVLLDQIFKKFPNDTAAAASLYCSNESFRNLCEDYSLAQITLASFEKMPDALHRSEVAEYRSIIFELEAEISNYLANATSN